VGEGELLRGASGGRADLLFVAFGPIVQRALAVADRLQGDGWSVAVVNARFARPLDVDLIVSSARGAQVVVTFEESVEVGGFGSGVLEALASAALGDPALRGRPVQVIGIPAGRFVDHGAVTDLRRSLRLDVDGLEQQVRETIDRLGLVPGRDASAEARAG
jgi:1-deoxy-D-xylulose-5-phosphate synthase